VILAALEDGSPLPDQAAYDAFHAAQDPGWLRAYHERFYEERAAFAARDPEGWLARMPPYAPFVAILRRRAGDAVLAIATAKDHRSVSALLRAYGLADLFDPRRVLDKETGVSKRAHLERLQADLRLPFKEITFLDDKVNHLESVAPLGVRCALAAWGYNGPRERARARDLGFLVCRLEDVELQLFGAPPARVPREVR
jgi:phosphoglycolate phosphatase-like HAD superfamily hydrolase